LLSAAQTIPRRQDRSKAAGKRKKTSPERSTDGLYRPGKAHCGPGGPSTVQWPGCTLKGRLGRKRSTLAAFAISFLPEDSVRFLLGLVQRKKVSSSFAGLRGEVSLRGGDSLFRKTTKGAPEKYIRRSAEEESSHRKLLATGSAGEPCGLPPSSEAFFLAEEAFCFAFLVPKTIFGAG